MRASDIKSIKFSNKTAATGAGPGRTRRAWLQHCSRTVLAASAATVMTAFAVVVPDVEAADNTSSPRTLLVVGDSLSAEYGLARGSGWVALLEKRLAQEGLKGQPNWRVVNASISGDTTSGGRSRLPALLKLHQPALVLIELGGNDALRGLPLKMTEANLGAMTRAAQAAGAQVLLAGIAVPPNYGRQYSQDLVQLFVDVAKVHKAALVPFLLAGVADVPNADKLFQPDRIHPTAQAQPQLLDNVWPVLLPLLR